MDKTTGGMVLALIIAIILEIVFINQLRKEKSNTKGKIFMSILVGLQGAMIIYCAMHVVNI